MVDHGYSNRLQKELLRPLTHPSELATHPTYSLPFTSKALPDMIAQTEDQLRREKISLEHVKKLHRQLVGDEAWIPCEVVESADDWNLFEPQWKASSVDMPHGKKRRRDGVVIEDAHSLPSAVGSVFGLDVKNATEDTDMRDAETEDSTNKHNGSNSGPENRHGGSARTMQHEGLNAIDIINGTRSDHNGGSTDETIQTDSATEAGSPDKRRPGINSDEMIQNDPQENAKSVPNGHDVDKNQPNNTDDLDETLDDSMGTVVRNLVDGDDKDKEGGSRSASASPPVPTRRITRALAQTTNSNVDGSAAPSAPVSPTLSSSSLDIHPLFLIRPLRPDISQQSPFNLPPAEHTETLGLLTQYIQKQTAFVNTLTSVLHRLLQAERLRKTVFHWSKAEGHFGEMSDGEDWIDEAEWGLERGELKKGKGDEEELEVQDGYLGRGKGKRRRNAG